MRHKCKLLLIKVYSHAMNYILHGSGMHCDVILTALLPVSTVVTSADCVGKIYVVNFKVEIESTYAYNGTRINSLKIRLM